MKIKTSELTGPALDWAVGLTQGGEHETNIHPDHGPLLRFPDSNSLGIPPYSTDWSQGGPLIEAYHMSLQKLGLWTASHMSPDGARMMASGYGGTPLIAAMRALVTSKLGDEVDVPDELVTQ